jgi:N,N-dimethylformamidase
MASDNIHGYSDQISVKAGDRIKFMVSVEGATGYRAEIVRLINGDANPAGPGPKEEVIASVVNKQYPGRFQPIHAGSYVLIDDGRELLNVDSAITVHAFIMPTTPSKGVQPIVSRYNPLRQMGWAMVIEETGRLALWIGDGAGRTVQVAAPTNLAAGVWYSAGASYDRASGRAIVHLSPVVNAVNSTVGRVASLPPAITHETEAERIGFQSGVLTTIAGWATSETAERRTVIQGILQRQNRSSGRLWPCATSI